MTETPLVRTRTAEVEHVCDWCEGKKPCMACGPDKTYWICGDCEIDAFLFHCATGGDLEPVRKRA